MGTAVTLESSAQVPASSAAIPSSSAALPSSAAASAPVVSGPPAKYEWQIPTSVKELDPAIVTRTEARARTRGLTNEEGQQLLNETIDEVQTQRTAHEAALIDAWKPGGTEWKKRDSDWRAAALADPSIGNGSKERLATQIELAQKVRTALGGKDFDDFLTETGLGSHPAAIKFLAKIGKSMSESAFVPGGGVGADSGPKTLAQRMYGPDGTGKKTGT